MSQRPLSTEEIDAITALFDAYGGDVERWPSESRAAYGVLAQGDELRDAREAATAIDQWLDCSTQPSTPHDLQNRILAGFNVPSKPRGSFLTSLLGLVRNSYLVPAGALASLAMLGFSIGVWTMGADGYAPEYEAYAYLEESGWSTFRIDEGASWGAD